MFKFKSVLLGGACVVCFVAPAAAENFNIPGGDLENALNTYVTQTGVHLIVSEDAIKGIQSRGVKGDLPADQALSRILAGSGFTIRNESGVLAVVRGGQSSDASDVQLQPIQLAQAIAPRTAVETVTVTSSKLGGADVQSIPISITALSQEQLTQTQTAGGPDLVKQVPNLTFTKTNFTGYNIQIRGIGTQAISVTTDPAVAVAFNDIPFIRNHFFEQEFYDVAQAEVLRGPQGTLYGRNATAGVVNLVSAKPADQYEAMASVDVGNYNNRRLEAMLNIPVIGDKLDIRAAGEWTKRDGYSYNATTNKPVDGRDLWSSRLTIGFHPIEQLHANLVWEHFSEDDDRMRTAKQLCKKDLGPISVDGLDITNLPSADNNILNQSSFWRAFMSQGCLPTSLYSKDAFETPNGQAIPIVFALQNVFNALGGAYGGFLIPQSDPYASKTQSTNLRVIESDLTPTYKAKNDVIELNADFAVTPALVITSQTGYNKDELRSTEDFNRFNTAPNFLTPDIGTDGAGPLMPNGVYCDPQLGCSTKFVGEDLSQESAWQFSQEVRIASSFSGPFNFTAGANYLHYQTREDYFVFLNLLSLAAQGTNGQGAGDDFTRCYYNSAGGTGPRTSAPIPAVPYYSQDAGASQLAVASNAGCNDETFPGAHFPGTYIDPNSINSLDGNGHNYFRSNNPYRLNSFAGFGEAYYQVAPEIKLTAGLRWTDDSKRFWNIPSWVFLEGGGYPVESVINQEWKEWTGRFNVNWTPKLDFTDETMVYASYARGYKGGGANPPGPQGSEQSPSSQLTHPATFAPEFINAFELGTKNSLLNGDLTLNGDVFYYDYKGYQISQIVDRTSINLNFDAKVKGAEVEATWEPLPGLRFNFAGGYEDSSVNNGQSAIDLMDRTAGHTDWTIIKPFVTETSNCIVPTSFVRNVIQYLTIENHGGWRSYCAPPLRCRIWQYHRPRRSSVPHAGCVRSVVRPFNGAQQWRWLLEGSWR